MRSERLDRLHLDGLAIDSETHLIQPGLIAPPSVVWSIAESYRGALSGALVPKPRMQQLWPGIFADQRVTLIFANAPFDLLVHAADEARLGNDVMPQIFDLYDPGRTIVRGHCDGRVYDALMVERLHAIAQGTLGLDHRTGKKLKNKETGRDGDYSLDLTTSLVLAREDAKDNDRFRLKYALLENVPIPQWPFEARQYPVDDAKNTLEDALAQAGHLPSSWPHDWHQVLVNGQPATQCSGCGEYLSGGRPGPDCMRKQRRRNIHDLSRQAYAHWALHLSSSWGFHVDQEAVDKLEAKVCHTDPEAQRAHLAEKQLYIDAGIIRPDGTEDQIALKTRVARAYGAVLPCKACEGTGKMPSPKTNGRTKINCDQCGGTKLELTPDVPRTDTGGVAGDRDTLLQSGDELLMKYEEFSSDKIKTTYLPLLRSARPCGYCGKSGYGKDGKHEPTCPTNFGSPAIWRYVPLIPRPSPLVETGRCAYRKGLHGLPRKGGVRECIIARPGYVLSSEDYTAGELVTHGENCIRVVGYSKLAEALNGGLDAHLALAGTMSGRDYAAMVAAKKAGEARAANDRQASKAANFGFGGGMAELTFTLRNRANPDLFTPCPLGPDERDGVRGYNGLRTCILMLGHESCGGPGRMTNTYNNQPCTPVCIDCLRSGKQLREFWFKQWPENNPRDGYFARIKQMIEVPGPSGTSEIVHHVTNRIRGGVGFCDGANGLFQGLLADAAKDAFCQIVRECYDKTCRVYSSEMMTSRFDGLESPLYGSRAQLLAHDETIAEHPECQAHEAAIRVSEIMVESLRFKCPHMKKAAKADPTLMRRLYKGAEPVYLCGCGKKNDKEKCECGRTDGRLIPWEPKPKKAA